MSFRSADINQYFGFNWLEMDVMNETDETLRHE